LKGLWEEAENLLKNRKALRGQPESHHRRGKGCQERAIHHSAGKKELGYAVLDEFIGPLLKRRWLDPVEA
jgi:hypothetical protein